jgi:hypothetical protein
MRSRLPFLSVSDCPGGDQPSPNAGDRAASESLQMYSDSRKAQLNSFAHHRAALLFSTHLARRGDAKQWSAAVHEGTEPTSARDLARRVIAGIHGFVPAVPAVI